MFEVESLNELLEDEILRLYELFFGPVLLKKSSDTYVTSLKSLLNNEGVVEKLIEKLNNSEVNVLRLLSILPKTPITFINEKISILLGEHPSIIGKIISNLQNKNFIFVRENRYIIVPALLTKKSAIQPVNIQLLNNDKGNSYDSISLAHISNLLLYMLTKEIKFSKSGTLYKKDFDELQQVFNSFTGFTKEEYDIIAYFCSFSFVNNDEIDWIAVEAFFNLKPHEKMLEILKTVFPYLNFVIDTIYENKTNCTINLNSFKDLYKSCFLSSELKNEPFKIDIIGIINFLLKIDFFAINDDVITVKYYETYVNKKMDIKLSSNYSIYINSDTTEPDFFKNAIFSNLVKYDKVAEFEINDISIKRSIHSGFAYSYFLDFVKDHSVELTSNVESTIKSWYEKHSSYYMIEGTLFFCETEEKGKIISKLIENGLVNAYEMKPNSIFLIPNTEKNTFFDFLDKSKITYYEKKPKSFSVKNLHDTKLLFDKPNLIRFVD